jgi:succinate dehydrogenase / fumarate reductase flavoprotein subunit
MSNVLQATRAWSHPSCDSDQKRDAHWQSIRSLEEIFSSLEEVKLAYDAGAELVDMEFVQFHPTGMIWPPSVQGILVTEAVRGEGGVLKNSDGRRFMWDDIPENYRAQTASDEEEGWRYTQGDKAARRPPELLTRDHVSRCINREVKAGRGSPHGGVFLDIAWIKARIPNSAEHIKKKLPSMYHQFKQLADIDITEVPMEVGPTTHYIMGGIKVDGDSQMSTVPGLFAAGECAAGLHGANRLGGNSLSDLLVFGKRAGECAAAYAKAQPGLAINPGDVEAASVALLPPTLLIGACFPVVVRWLGAGVFALAIALTFALRFAGWIENPDLDALLEEGHESRHPW